MAGGVEVRVCSWSSWYEALCSEGGAVRDGRQRHGSGAVGAWAGYRDRMI